VEDCDVGRRWTRQRPPVAKTDCRHCRRRRAGASGSCRRRQRCTPAAAAEREQTAGHRCKAASLSGYCRRRSSSARTADGGSHAVVAAAAAEGDGDDLVVTMVVTVTCARSPDDCRTTSCCSQNETAAALSERQVRARPVRQSTTNISPLNYYYSATWYSFYHPTVRRYTAVKFVRGMSKSQVCETIVIFACNPACYLFTYAQLHRSYHAVCIFGYCL